MGKLSFGRKSSSSMRSTTFSMINKGKLSPTLGVSVLMRFASQLSSQRERECRLGCHRNLFSDRTKLSPMSAKHFDMAHCQKPYV